MIDNLKESQDGRKMASQSLERRLPTDSLPEPKPIFKSESHGDLLMSRVLANNDDRIYDSLDDLERVLSQAEDDTGKDRDTLANRLILTVLQKRKCFLPQNRLVRKKRERCDRLPRKK